jgi:hypothetical protein
MANHTGKDGLVKIGSDTLGELRTWSYSVSGEVIEDTTMGDTARTYQAGLTTWSGTAESYWDEADTAQTALTAGASITLAFYPEGADSGDTYYSGSAIVTEVSSTAAMDGMVEISFSFTGSGALSSATV